MNRLPTLDHGALGAVSQKSSSKLQLTAANAQGESALGVGSLEVGDRRQEPACSVFTPLHYEQGYAYPLLVWLHGDGGSERELRRVMPHVSVRNYVAVAARGAADGDADASGYSWRDSAAGAADAADDVRRSIDLAMGRYHVHQDRVFIAGYQGGGTMALRLAMSYPEWFAGAISLGGPMPSGDAPLRRVNEARHLPLMLACCRECRQYAPRRVADDLRLLHSAGFSLALRQYPGETGLTTAMLSDMDRWMMGLICPESSQTAS